MELQIFYMTIQESKDILKKEGILIENQSDFDRFLKEIGSKSFQEKHFHFPRYDNIKKLFEILKERKLWTNPPFMKKNEQINNNPIEDFSMTSSPMKITASAMRHDSLESNDRTSESDYSK